MKAKHFLSLIIGLSPFYYLAGQILKGQVMDEKTAKPLPGALIIFKKSAGDFTGKVLTDENGTYQFFQPFEKGNYDFEISSAGYNKKSISASILEDTVLNIPLTSKLLELEEVIIVKDKTQTEIFLDKKVINVGKDLLSGGGDALTVLSRVPEIQSDSNGNISLKGDKNVNVLVNGKPSPLSVAELLRQIPASNINKIEIITSPSAKYTASGLTGIINIITNKKIASGVSVNTSGSGTSLGGYTGDAEANVGGEKVSYSFGVGYVKDILKSRSIENRGNTDPIRVENDFKFIGDIFKAKGRVDWFINKSNELSVGLNYTDNSHKMLFDGIIFQKDDRLPQNNLSSHDHKTFDLTTNYRHVFSKPENYLELDLYISNNTNLVKNEFQKNIGLANNMTDDVVAVSRASADYSTKLNETVKLDAGLLWERQSLDNNFSVSETGMEAYRAFKNVQSTYASYGMLKFDINKLNIQAGLRGEIFRRDANLITAGSKMSSEFVNLFPSLHISYNISDRKMVAFGYNRRTTRPTLEQVNPNTDQSSRFEIFEGSPDLRPEFSNNFDINFQLKKTGFNFNTGVSYRLREDVILNYFSVNDKGTTVYKPFNGGNSNAFGIDFSTAFAPLKWWDSKVSVNWNYETSRHRDVFFFRNFNTGYSLTLQNDLKLSNKAELGITWKYDSAQKFYLSDTRENQGVDIAFRYKIMKNKGNITLRFADILNTKVYEGLNYGVGFVNNYRFKPVSRAVYLSFTYNIKKGKKINERNIKAQDYKREVMK